MTAFQKIFPYLPGLTLETPSIRETVFESATLACLYRSAHDERKGQIEACKAMIGKKGGRSQILHDPKTP